MKVLAKPLTQHWHALAFKAALTAIEPWQAAGSSWAAFGKKRSQAEASLQDHRTIIVHDPYPSAAHALLRKHLGKAFSPASLCTQYGGLPSRSATLASLHLHAACHHARASGLSLS
eukprot:11033330-Alexandrium_andersonii.AAC.1